MADSALYTAAVAVYDFENNANATKGSNLSGTGATYSTTGEAQGTYWLGEMVGSGDFRVTNSAFNIDEDYSVSFWTQCQYMTAGVGPYIRLDNGSGSAGFYIDFSSRNMRVSHMDGATPRTVTFTGYNFNDDQRYHIVVAFDASANTVTAWVSSSSFGDCINGTSLSQTYDADVASGAQFIVNNEWYGFYDEVVLWKSVLTSSDATAIFGARDGGTSWRETGEASSTPTLKRRLNILLRLCLSTFNLIWRCFK